MTGTEPAGPRRRPARGGRRPAPQALALAALLALTAFVLVGAGLRDPADAPPAEPGDRLATPLWSARRVPGPVTDAVDAERLGAELAATTQGMRACWEVADASGTVATAGADEALVPASTIKLLTATAALDRLGADATFVTRAVAPAAPDDGRVDRLWLVGGGDPLLASPERIAARNRDPDTSGLPVTPLADLADRIVAAGVRAVPGGVLGVDDRYEATRVSDAWDAGARAAIGSVGALVVNGGRAGTEGAGPASPDPAVAAATELGRLLAARGVSVGPPGRADAAPGGGTEVAAVESPPLRDVLTEILSASDNLGAEMLLRELAFRDDGSGTTAHGIEVVERTLAEAGVDLSGTTIVDGSGLARADALTCPVLLAVLRLPGHEAVRDALAIAGQRGTLADRLRGGPLVGNLRAKTGTLNGVSGLAGYVTADRPLTFALVVNGSFGESGAQAVRETMASAIAAFGATAADVVPPPGAPIPAQACPPPDEAC